MNTEASKVSRDGEGVGSLWAWLYEVTGSRNDMTVDRWEHGQQGVIIVADVLPD